jgi:hypothetical protein
MMCQESQSNQWLRHWQYKGADRVSTASHPFLLLFLFQSNLLCPVYRFLSCELWGHLPIPKTPTLLPQAEEMSQ